MGQVFNQDCVDRPEDFYTGHIWAGERNPDRGEIRAEVLELFEAPIPEAWSEPSRLAA